MKRNFDNVKKKIREEFEWMQKNYPLSLFKEVELKLYDAEQYNVTYDDDEYGEKEIDAFVIDNITEKEEVEFAIFMVVDEHHEADKVDKMILEKGSIKEEHLYFFMLYHEYGHLMHYHDAYKRSGLKGLEKEMEETGDEVNELILQNETGKLTEEEFEKAYREMWFEKYADDFAYRIHKIRKNELEKI